MTKKKIKHAGKLSPQHLQHIRIDKLERKEKLAELKKLCQIRTDDLIKNL